MGPVVEAAWQPLITSPRAFALIEVTQQPLESAQAVVGFADQPVEQVLPLKKPANPDF